MDFFAITYHADSLQRLLEQYGLESGHSELDAPAVSKYNSKGCYMCCSTRLGDLVLEETPMSNKKQI